MNRFEFNGLLPVWLMIPLSLALMGLVWWWYFKESKYARAPFHWLLPTLRALALGAILWMLAGPAWVREWVSGELSRIAVLVDTSASMELKDSETEQSSRLERAMQWLNSTSEKELGWLDKQRTEFHLRLFPFSDENSGSEPTTKQSTWDSIVDRSTKPTRLELSPSGTKTAIGEALSGVIRSGSSATSLSEPSNASQRPYSAVLLLSDGQSNSGESPSSVAERFAQASIPVFAIGYGQEAEPNDLGILAVEHSRSLFRSDSFQGTATIKQRIPAGRQYRIEIRSGTQGQVLWSKTLESDGAASRTIEYRIPGEKLFSSQESASRSKATPLDLQFEVIYDGQDASQINDTFDSSLWGIIRKIRVLVMDQRGRWESRYVKNAFGRDSAWDLKSILGPDEYQSNPFPKTREDLIDLDLIVMAADSLSGMNDTQLRWLADYIADLGGGLILIDSGRDKPLGVLSNKEVDWLPVSFIDNETAPLTVASLNLELDAVEQRAFAFEQDTLENRRLWEAFPAPRTARRVRSAPGAQVMVSGKSDNQQYPMIVTRRSGQGRVVYVANDETWRWRYNVADLYHQRFWNQLAQWCMQPPYAIQNDYVGLDAGDRVYDFGKPIPIRARLRNAQQEPLSGAKALAVIEQNGVRIQSMPLVEEAEGTGMVTGLATGLLSGRYQVRLEVPGMPTEALDLETEFLVHPPEDLEMEVLASNRSLLEQIAKTTGGKYYDQSQADRVNESLRGLRTGKIEQSRTLLWQSYPWFLAVMTLLAIEWYLRKRAGLI
ncbi:MAG: VWA domain-containing protein [Planctomycetes bacterium]|nr:VWA domain-containing protein [Planctomycetota bacterium]